MRFLTPWGKRGRVLHLPESAVIAYPSDGVRLYRLVKRNPPTEEDFQPQHPKRAEVQGSAEICRLAFSHFAEPEQAEAAMWQPERQMVARVTLPANERIHIARTEKDLPGHYDVWVPLDLLEEIIETAEIVD